MKLNDFRVFAFTFAIAATTGLAHAGQISFNDANCQATSSSSPVTCSTSAAGVNYSATVTGWSASGGGKFGSAALDYYSGYGVGITSPYEPTTSPQHAIDNYGATEALLISFGSTNVALNQLSFGWVYNDADVSILRYTGTQAPTLTTRTVADLKNAAGWEWVGDYAYTSDILNFNTGTDAKTASWWLVSAYDSAYSGLAPSRNLGDDNDFFKLSGFAATPVAKPTTPTPTQGNPVPEPGTFALFGIALAGFVAARRKSKAM